MFTGCKEEIRYGRGFYTNALENMHKPEKKYLSENNVGSEVLKVSKAIKSCASEFHNEAVYAIRGLGKYRRRDEYKNFYRDPVTWNRMTNDQQIDLIEKFYLFVPNDTTYHKTSYAGMKRADYGKK